MAKSPEAMAATMKSNIAEKTGKSLEAWIKILKPAKLGKHGQIVSFLKSEHGVTHGFANMIAHEFLGAGKPATVGDDLVSQQYSGAKAELRPIYDALMAVIGKLGKDIEISPKKAYVSLRRNKQFAMVQPTTKDRIDVGINLKGVSPTSRLEASGSFNSMVTHRVRITDKKQIDTELKNWLKAAYAAS
jgi:hypothetical protein